MESWEHGDKPLFAGETEGSKLTPEETQVFLRFLRYRFGLHPDIIAAAEKREIIPNRMEIYRYNMQVEHFSLQLVTVQRTPDVLDQKLFLADTPTNPEGVIALCEKAMAMSPADYRAACDDVRAAGQKQREAGNTFGALLLLMEYGLCTDAQLPADIASMKDSIQRDPDCMKLFSCLMPASKEAVEQAIKDLQVLEAKTTWGKRSLKVFRANNLSNLGRTEEAKALFLEVLTENPAHVGGWKDLGDLFYNEYDMPTAWHCWDAGRHLLPTHKSFRPVYELEKQLTEKYPEFL
jgi:tetratricopeptide (TPR) repeat protein